jgi:hypothetical protein
MSFPVTGFESNGSERYTCLLGIGVVQSGLTCFFLYIVVCVFVHLQISLWLLLAGICECLCGSFGIAHTAVCWCPGLQHAALRAHLGVPLFVCVCVCILFMYHALAFGCRFSSWPSYLKLTC